ncbi:mobile element protein [Streptomyces sp. NL15-2K]|nr:mobile element protein [Streptomyces sp. NL15-2K]
MDRDVLRAWLASVPVAAELATRARIVLLAADGLSNSEIARRLGVSRQTVVTWRGRYRSSGTAGLRDRPRSGRPAAVDEVRVVVRTLQGPPEDLGARRWSSRLLAAELGVSNVAVAKVWRKWQIQPWRHGEIDFPTEPVLEKTARDVLGLYLAPPEKAVVVRTDGAGGIPAPEGNARSRLGPAGRHDETSHSAAALITALETAPTMPATERHRDDALLRFLRSVAGAHEQERLHLVVDGYDAGRHPAVRTWLAGQRRIALHRTPAAVPWPDLVEIFFAVGAEPAAWNSPAAPGVGAALRRYLDAYGEHSPPFAWIRAAGERARRPR